MPAPLSDLWDLSGAHASVSLMSSRPARRSTPGRSSVNIDLTRFSKMMKVRLLACCGAGSDDSRMTALRQTATLGCGNGVSRISQRGTRRGGGASYPRYHANIEKKAIKPSRSWPNALYAPPPQYASGLLQSREDLTRLPSKATKTNKGSRQ